MATKCVYLGNAIPDEVTKLAQVMIVDGNTWHLIAPGQRAHGAEEMKPTVTCPIVDISKVKDESGMRAVMLKCTDPNAGVLNLAGLLTGLEALGAKVSKCQSVEVSKPTAAEVAARFRNRKDGRVARRVHMHRKVAVN